MKLRRILASVLSVVMLITCFSSFAVLANSGKHLFFELSSKGESTIIVEAGEEFTVDFYAQNMTDDEVFGITALENQIEYKHDFFEFVSADPESGTAYWAKDGECSWDRTIRWLEIMASHYPQPAGYNDRQLVMTVKFKVKDDIAEGSSGVLSSKACFAAYGDAEHTVSTKDMRVYVGKIPETTYTLTYISEGNKVNTAQDLAKDAVVNLYGIPPVVTDKKFGGWVDENGTVWAENAQYTVTGDMTFNAKWLSKYTLSFETNGGSSVSSLVRWEDQDINVSEFAATSKPGFDFVGWYEDRELSKPVDGTFKLTTDKTIYAKWVEATKPTYTLTFNTNGGSAYETLTKEEGTVINLSSYNPTKSGYTFEGWYSDKECTTKVTSVTLDANKTVYAKWKKEEGSGGGGGGGSAPIKYTITFADPDGTKLDSLQYKENITVDLSKFIFDKDGYVFDGWYTDKELTNKVTSVKITKDLTLYAKWNKKDDTTPLKPGNHPEILTKDHYAYIVGREGGRIEPQANITRAEVATIFFRLLTEEVRKENLTRTNNFSDVADDSWYNTAVSTLASLGIINGRTEDNFAPAAYITRAEFTAIAARFSDAEYNGEDLFADISGHWAQDYINRAASLGWVQGENGIFRPDDKITRAEVMTLVNRVLGRVPESEADLSGDMTRWEDNADTSAWYYLAVQEATNSHDYELKADGIHERWLNIKANPNWAEFEK